MPHKQTNQKTPNGTPQSPNLYQKSFGLSLLHGFFKHRILHPEHHIWKIFPERRSDSEDSCSPADYFSVVKPPGQLFSSRLVFLTLIRVLAKFLVSLPCTNMYTQTTIKQAKSKATTLLIFIHLGSFSALRLEVNLLKFSSWNQPTSKVPQCSKCNDHIPADLFPLHVQNLFGTEITGLG